MFPWLILYALVFLAAGALSLAACALARAAGLRLGLLDHPGGRKAHPEPVALTGGWGIVAAFLLPVAAGLAFATPLADALPVSTHPDAVRLSHYLRNIEGIRPQLAAVLAGTLIVFVLGLVDDLRPLSPRLKLAGQCLAVLPLLAAGLGASGFLPAPLGWLLTLFWVVLLTNSFNLLDNMDGLTASVAGVICLVLSVAAVQGGELLLPALFLALAGALAGFLRFNFHPARMFMGDCGALTVGYLIAVFTILVTYNDLSSTAAPASPTPLPILMPLAIVAVPLFDTLSVIIIRLRNGKPIMQGDRNHFSHRLLAMGFTPPMATLTIATLTAATGLLALPLRYLHTIPAAIHLSGLILLLNVILALEYVGRKKLK